VDTTTVLSYRDRTILEVLYATGIRNEELRNLTVADVNLEEGLLRVNGVVGTFFICIGLLLLVDRSASPFAGLRSTSLGKMGS
jgi:Phage integrase family